MGVVVGVLLALAIAVIGVAAGEVFAAWLLQEVNQARQAHKSRIVHMTLVRWRNM